MPPLGLLPPTFTELVQFEFKVNSKFLLSRDNKTQTGQIPRCFRAGLSRHFSAPANETWKQRFHKLNIKHFNETQPPSMFSFNKKLYNTQRAKAACSQAHLLHRLNGDIAPSPFTWEACNAARGLKCGKQAVSPATRGREVIIKKKTEKVKTPSRESSTGRSLLMVAAAGSALMAPGAATTTLVEHH